MYSSVIVLNIHSLNLQHVILTLICGVYSMQCFYLEVNTCVKQQFA